MSQKQVEVVSRAEPNHTAVTWEQSLVVGRIELNPAVSRAEQNHNAMTKELNQAVNRFELNLAVGRAELNNNVERREEKKEKAKLNKT